MDLCTAPATELARLIRSRELSAAELLTAVLARIEAVNPALNAIVTLAAEQAHLAAPDRISRGQVSRALATRPGKA